MEMRHTYNEYAQSETNMLTEAELTKQTFSVERVSVDALSEADRRQWNALRASNPVLYSPYFHIGYTELLSTLRDDVSVIVLRAIDGEACAFLPIQGQRFARPAGAPMTDYHGFICAPDTHIDMSSALAKAGVGAFYFDHLVTPCDLPTLCEPKPIAAMDVSQGGDAWRESRDSSYRRHKKSCRRRKRKSEEECGPHRYEFMSADREAFKQMLIWKVEKYGETGRYNVLGTDWTQALLDTLWSRPSDGRLCIDMHVLYINDELAAVDAGLSDGTTFHSWMVAYNPKFHIYSPGTQLLEALIDEASNLGYSRIDLGAGLEGYKRYYTGIDIQVRSGFVAARGPAATLARVYGAAERFGESAKLGKAGRLPGRLRRRYQQIAACDPSFSGRTKAMLSALKNNG